MLEILVLGAERVVVMKQAAVVIFGSPLCFNAHTISDVGSSYPVACSNFP